MLVHPRPIHARNKIITANHRHQNIFTVFGAAISKKPNSVHNLQKCKLEICHRRHSYKLFWRQRRIQIHNTTIRDHKLLRLVFGNHFSVLLHITLIYMWFASNRFIAGIWSLICLPLWNLHQKNPYSSHRQLVIMVQCLIKWTTRHYHTLLPMCRL